MKQTMAQLEGKTGGFTMTYWDFNTQLSVMDGTTRYNKEMEHLNNTINKLDLRDIHIIHQFSSFLEIIRQWQNIHSPQVNTG